jgi:regulatory protein
MPTVPTSFKEEYKKVERYCAFQEKCAFDVHRKLRDMEVPRAESEQIILVLTEKGFIDHDRYCDAFVNDHINIKRWGRQKIKASLKAKSLPAISIDRALNKIEFSTLSDNLIYLMNRKIKDL